MSAISLKSITGITSITTPTGVDDQLTLHNNNTTERVKIDTAGNVHINNHLAVTGVTTNASTTYFDNQVYCFNYHTFVFKCQTRYYKPIYICYCFFSNENDNKIIL